MKLLIADGSEIRSLAGRTAKLGDGFSRNPKGRDELLEQRTLDVRGLSGQLRGFDLDAYLSDEMPEGPVPWAVGDHALPGGHEDVAYVGSLHGLVAAKLKILVAVDYEKDAEKALQRVCEEFKMPEWTVTVHPCYGAFEDDDGVWAQFDGATGRLQGDRKVKRARVDLLTSASKLARAIADYGPDFVVGFGQGGIVAGILRWPLVLEVVLQARNLQRKEAQEICLAWARVKAIWAVAPRWWRTKPEAGLLKAACPELALEFPVEPIKGYASVPKGTVKDQEVKQVVEVLRVPEIGRINSQNLAGLAREKDREMWEHDGLCACGKRTYVFSRCPTCIRREAQDAVVEAQERKEREERGDLEELDGAALIEEVGAASNIANRTGLPRSSGLRQSTLGEAAACRNLDLGAPSGPSRCQARAEF